MSEPVAEKEMWETKRQMLRETERDMGDRETTPLESAMPMS